jgi:enhancing lycopene biosynthesis protein 2
MKTIGVVLSGCGVQDGSEIHEAVATLVALSKRGATAVCFAPDDNQARVMDHAAGQEALESRNMLVEAARIARGEISPLSEANVDKLDGIIMPGGFGAALNLSDFGSQGRNITVRPDLEALLGAFADAGKPIAALCIAPPILAKLMQKRGVTGAKVTIGNDPSTAIHIEALGQTHVNASATDVVVDTENKLVTSPAYMLAGNIAELFEGIDKAVGALLELA